MLCLVIQIAAPKAKPVHTMNDCIAQTADSMHHTGLSIPHGQHLTDAAGLKRTGHQKKIPVGIKDLGRLI